jgi:hypothetical protein
VYLGSLAVAAGVHPGLGGVGRTCRAWASLVTLPEDVVKDGELVGQGQASVAGLLVSYIIAFKGMARSGVLALMSPLH